MAVGLQPKRMGHRWLFGAVLLPAPSAAALRQAREKRLQHPQAGNTGRLGLLGFLSCIF